MDNNTKKRLLNLIASAKDAVELLTDEVKKPVDEDLADDKARNAFKAKKECFMDAKELIFEIDKMEGVLEGRDEYNTNIKNKKTDETEFKAGAMENFATKPN
mgnify:FL=1